MIVITEQGEIIKTNPKARELLGYGESEFDEITYSTLLADDTTGTNKGLPFPFRTGERTHHAERLLKTKSKAQLLAELVATRLSNDRILLLVRDITKRSKLESNSNGPTADKTRVLNQMAGCIAEELNQSLTSIMSHRDLLVNHIASHPDISSTCTEPLRQILAGVQQANSVTTQLAHFSSQSPVLFESIDLAPFLSGTLLNLRDELGKDTSIHFHVASDADTLFADGGQLNFALTQIVRALDIKSMREKTVTLLARPSPTPRNVIVTLELKSFRLADIDTRNIFEPFSGKKTDTLETGIGLSTAHRIVTQMKGSIDVTQAGKDRLEFNITLPSGPGTNKVAHHVPSTEKPLRTQAQETVLVCEDNEAIRLAIEGLLRASGYSVHLVQNGHEALEFANQPENNIAVLISDIRMPGISGKELAIKIRTDFPEIQIILISGHTGGIVSDDWLAEEKIKFLAKPFTHASLIEAVSESNSTYRSLNS
jgi:two-component system, cell cycle sensor histidine kinase and response regulator CckA